MKSKDAVRAYLRFAVALRQRGRHADGGGRHWQIDVAQMHIREKVPRREIAVRTGLFRNTSRSWLRQVDAAEPKHPERVNPSAIDKWSAQLTVWFRAENHRPRRDWRTARFTFETIPDQGRGGCYGLVSAFTKRSHEEQVEAPRRKANVTLAFEPREAFQFNWICEYGFIRQTSATPVGRPRQAERQPWLLSDRVSQSESRDAIRRTRQRIRLSL